MNRRHFGIEDDLSTGFFKLSNNGRREVASGGRGNGRSRVAVIIMVCARAAPKENVLLALSCQASARFLLDDLE